LPKNEKVIPRSGGVGFFGLLAILFIGLKLTGHITWSWWWVLAPLWMPLTLAIIMFIIAVIVVMIVAK
jgi:hypothetical protein